MAHTMENPAQKAEIPGDDYDVDCLNAWYQEYTADKPSLHQKTYPSHAQLIQGVPEEIMHRYVQATRKLKRDKGQEVDSDPIDAAHVQTQLQLSMSDVSVSQALCKSCHRLFSRWPDPQGQSRYRIERKQGIYEIEAAAQHGCKFCAFLLYQLKESEVLDRFRKIQKRLMLLGKSAAINLIFGAKSGMSDTYEFSLNFPGIVQEPAILFDGQILEAPDTSYGDLIDDFEVLNKWLSVCKDHEKCNVVPDRSGKDERPSRLIHIANNTVKLVLTEKWETMPRYATLSYCWGGVDFIKTTRDKLDTFLNNIPFEDLPKTFRDAIDISRKLDLEYIWIDALCIVQAQGNEHALDWYNESGRMRYIYGHSYLNIAASIGKNPHEGCFHTPPNYNAGFVTQVTTGGISKTMKIDHMEWQDYNNLTTRTHLASRAWAFQERLLAPRTIYLTGQGLLWECMTSVASSSFPEDISASSITQMVRPAGEEWEWFDIVSSFSRGRLTNQEDKLPALSGIAKRQHEVSGDTYLAGMWRATLKERLSWSAVAKGRRSDPRIPTWSWASLDAEIWFGKNNIRHVEVLDARTTLRGTDTFGEVLGGELRLRCVALVRGRYLAASDESKKDRVVFDTSSHEFPIEVDCSDDSPKLGDSVLLLPLVIGDNGSMRGGVVATHPKLEALYEEIKLHGKTVLNPGTKKPEIRLHGNGISQANDTEYLYQMSLQARGLILQRAPSSKKGHFRRIGYFEYDYDIDHLLDENQEDLYHAFLDVVNKDGTETASSLCEDVWVPAEHTGRHEADCKPEDNTDVDVEKENLTQGPELEPGAENSAISPQTVHPGARFIITIV